VIIVSPPFRGLEHKNKAIYFNDDQARSDVLTNYDCCNQAISINDMDKQRKAEFTKRPDGKPLAVARHYASGEPLKCPVEIGDVRDLKIGEEVVYVEVIDDLENGKFKAAIVSFDSSPEDEYRGHKTGDTIYFEEAHVWA
jgi:hypothetical protein